MNCQNHQFIKKWGVQGDPHVIFLDRVNLSITIDDYQLFQIYGRFDHSGNFVSIYNHYVLLHRMILQCKVAKERI